MTLGRVYGVQWRHWKRPDGSRNSTSCSGRSTSSKTNPDSKGIIVSAWNAGELGDKRWNPNDYGEMRCRRATPCSSSTHQGQAALQLYQRSWDVFLGAPFNIAQYAMLLHMVAYLIDAEPRELIIAAGNAHLYKNHLEPAKEQLHRKPYPFPKLKIVAKSRVSMTSGKKTSYSKTTKPTRASRPIW